MGSLTMVPGKAKHLSSVNHNTKTIQFRQIYDHTNKKAFSKESVILQAIILTQIISNGELPKHLGQMIDAGQE